MGGSEETFADTAASCTCSAELKHAMRDQRCQMSGAAFIHAACQGIHQHGGHNQAEHGSVETSVGRRERTTRGRPSPPRGRGGGVFTAPSLVASWTPRGLGWQPQDWGHAAMHPPP